MNPLDRLRPALDAELRQARDTLGWTRQDLRRALPDWRAAHPDTEGETEGTLCLQILAGYELGTRTPSVLRLAELAAVLGLPASVLLHNAEARAQTHTMGFGGCGSTSRAWPAAATHDSSRWCPGAGPGRRAASRRSRRCGSPPTPWRPCRPRATTPTTCSPDFTTWPTCPYRPHRHPATTNRASPHDPQ